MYKSKLTFLIIPIIIGLFLSYSINNFAQIKSESENINDISDSTKTEDVEAYLIEKTIDTLTFKYKFVPGDSLFYSVFSRDSIVINYDAPLLRLRHEQILITCDSINKAGNFCLTQKTINYRAVESYKQEKNVESKESEWLNVPVQIVIDSLGHRIKVYNADTIHAVLAPGGPFKPILIMTLAEKDSSNQKVFSVSKWSNGNIDTMSVTWFASTSDTLVENGMPMPVLKNKTLFRLRGQSDTLNYHTNRFSFITTAQAAYELLTNDYKMRTAGIISSGGEVFLDTTLWIPVYFTQSMEQRLTFYHPDDKTYPGWHLLTTSYVLDKIVRPNKPAVYNKADKSTKIKKK